MTLYMSLLHRGFIEISHLFNFFVNILRFDIFLGKKFFQAITSKTELSVTVSNTQCMCNGKNRLSRASTSKQSTELTL